MKINSKWKGIHLTVTIGNVILGGTLILRYIIGLPDFIYPMTTRSNTPIALCESDSNKIRDFGSLLFFKMGVKSGYVPG